MKRSRLLALAFGIAACASATAPAVNREFDLLVRRQARVDGTPITLQFDSVAEDSRCPSGAQCVTQGTARVRIAVLFAAGPEYAVELSDSLGRNTAVVNGWFVDFLDLKPHPAVGVVVDPDRRIARFRVRPAPD
jgi:hypothetical protein